MTPKTFFNQDTLFTQLREENNKLKLDNANLRETVQTLSSLVESYDRKLRLVDKNAKNINTLFLSALDIVKKIEAKSEQKEEVKIIIKKP